MYGYGMQGPFMMGMGYPTFLRGAPIPPAPRVSSLLSSAPRVGGTGGILASLRGINWSGMLNNASKALGVVNQAIPVVKQVGPMMNNMKSMLKIASAFKDETDVPIRTTSDTSVSETTTTKEETKEEVNIKTDQNKPNFFL